MPKRWLLAAAVSLALGSSCTRLNRNFCDAAPHNNCGLLDGSRGDVDAAGDGGDGRDASEAPADLTEAAGDLRGDADSKRDCDSNTQCTLGAKPICDVMRGVCVPCVSDSQCVTKLGEAEPGICVDGTCPQRTEVIVVNIAMGCSDAQGGTPEVPLCDMKMAQDRLARTDEQRRIVVVRGADQQGWSLTVTHGRVVVIGQPVAKVTIASQAGISLVGVDVALRRLDVNGSGAAFPGINIGVGTTADLQEITVRGSTVTGVQASMAKSVRLNRVLLTGNGIGLKLAQTPFSVTNTIIAGSTVTGAVLDATGGPTPKFQNNTLVNNMVPLMCSANHTVSALLVYPEPAAGLASSGCFVRNSNTQLPNFSTADASKPYHLTAASPCKGMGDPDGFPMDDYDGETRPMGGASDCGADELTE